jgi:hypothetical protein
MKTLTYNGTTYTCPYAEVLPPLTPEERFRLAEDIGQRGIVVPVVVDDAHRIIDGQHRLEIAIEQGRRDVPFKVVFDLDGAQQRDLAEDLNLHRRHLTPKQQETCGSAASSACCKHITTALATGRLLSTNG